MTTGPNYLAADPLGKSREEEGGALEHNHKGTNIESLAKGSPDSVVILRQKKLGGELLGGCHLVVRRAMLFQTLKVCVGLSMATGDFFRCQYFTLSDPGGFITQCSLMFPRWIMTCKQATSKIH